MSRTPKTLEAAEAIRLLNYIGAASEDRCGKRMTVRNYCMAVLMLDAGLRVGELVKLQWNTLYFHDKPVNSIVLSPAVAKLERERIIPTTLRIRNACTEAYKNIWSAQGLAPAVYAFYNNTPHKHISTRQVERIIGDASQAAIGRRITPHVLRHTFATRMMRITSMPVVQELLGHKRLSSTQIYTHPNHDDLQKAIETLNGGV